MKKRKGKASPLEKKFLQAWIELGFEGSDITREYRIKGTEFIYDFAFPSQKLAIEINGRGGHQLYTALDRDAKKLNQAVFQGWKLLVFTSGTLGSKEKLEDAINLVCNVLSQGVKRNAGTKKKKRRRDNH